MTHYSLGLYLLGLLILTDVSVSQLRRSSKSSGSGVTSSGSSSSSSSGASASQIVDFDCPEEFGYYPHPEDCTQYYVCVFGGALLESCTGGLMYSHELQTCDWPRNVGCGEAVSTVKAVEPRPRQPIQLRPQHQPQQLQVQQQQQQYVQQRPLQRDEAIPKHHLYAEEDLGPAEEVESDRQQRVYRGQPATLGQVARDRDGLSRHSNALQAPPNGREKLSVISFGTQQQYSRQTIQPASYSEPTTTQRVTSRGYNTTQHQQYTPSPYDPYYNIYEDDTDLYKDIDYSQYTGQQYQAQPAYKEKQSQVPQQQVQPTPSRKPSVQYSPPPPQPQPQQSYNTVQQDVYAQAVSAQDYNDNYNLQDEDIDYKQSDLDLKSNRSRQSQAQTAPRLEGEKLDGKEKQQNTSRNQQVTLTAAFSFNDEKTPVTSSRRFEENARKRASISSFRVEEPPSTGPLRETHELVLSYIKQENEKDSVINEQENKTEVKTDVRIKQTSLTETLPKNNPKPFSHYSDNKTNQPSTSSTKDILSLLNEETKSRSARPFRIVVSSTTENDDLDQVTFRPRYTPRRGSIVQNDDSEKITPSELSTVKPYRLPPLTRDSVSSRTPQVSNSQTEPTKRSRTVQGNAKEELTSSRQTQTENGHLENSYTAIKSLQEFDDEVIKFIPITPQRSSSRIAQQETFQPDRASTSNQVRDIKVGEQEQRIPTQEYSPSEEIVPTSTNPSLITRGRDIVHQRRITQYTSTPPQVEESIFKYIPINAVRSRLTNKKNINNDDFHSDDTTYQRKIKENITVDRYEANLSQNKEQDSQLTTQDIADQKSNLYNHPESFLQKTFQKANDDQISNGRTQSRFSQTTESSIRKPLYSLRIDSESGKYKGQVNGVLATLETTANDNTKNELSQQINTQYSRPTNVEQEIKDEKDIESFNKSNNEKDEISNYNENNNSDQIRSRNRGRTFATATDTRRDEYNRGTVYTTTTNTPDSELVAHPARARIRTRPNQNKAEYENNSGSTSTYTTPEPYSTTEKQEITVTRNYSTETPTEEMYNNNNNNEFSDFQSRLDSNSEIYNRNYQKRAQLKSRNRLSSDFQKQNRGILNKETNFDSEEEIFSINNNKVTTERDIDTNDGLTLRGAQTWQSADEVYETHDDEDESESDRKFIGERQQNTRQMHIKKRIRITTLQPQSSTQRYDESDNKSKSRTVALKPTSDDLISSTRNKPSALSVGEDYRKVNEETDSLNTVSRSRDRLETRGKDVDDDENGFHRENNYNARGRDQAQIKSRNNPANQTVNSYTFLRQSSSSQESLPSTRLNTREFTDSQGQNNAVARNETIDARTNIMSQTYSPIAAEINSYFKEVSASSTSTFTPIVDVKSSTTVAPTTTFERIRDKFRLGSFPKPTLSSHVFARKPSVEDSTPPPLPSDRCSQELDNDSECNDKPDLRVRPTSASPDSQATPGLTRGGSRHRGSATYTVAPNEAEPAPTPNRGTPSSLSRNRPTLKPSTSIVSKASEFIDIYRYPPTRPEPIYPTPQVDKTAAKCRKDVCLLPDCSCGGKEIPGDLPPEQTPQIVLLTFDDSVNDLNKGLYSDLFEKGRTNPNGCPIAATFYVSHEWTDYSQVQNLYAGGHEMASHSVSHSFGEQFSVKKWTREIAGQREILSAYGGVRLEDIRGMRAPFLSIGGNKMFKMLYDANFTYDSSMPVYENKPPSWPYTLDYKIFHDCMIPPCPTRSYPGVWEVPMVMWQDLNGGRCSMGDACSNPPASDGVYKMLIKNFERHFTTNRAPFGLFYHAAWFTQPHHKEGFIAFLDAITKMPEVWVVTNWQAVQWVRDPTPISRLNNFAPFQCNYPERPRRCNNPKVCNLWHKSGVRYMRTCQPCPEIYPWTGKSGVRNSRVDNEIITD